MFVFILSILKYLITEGKHIWWTWKNMAWDLKKVFHLIASLLYSTACIEMYKLQNTITALSEIVLFLSYQKCYICNERYNLGNEKCFRGNRSIHRNKCKYWQVKHRGKIIRQNRERSHSSSENISMLSGHQLFFFIVTWCISSNNLKIFYIYN